MTALADSVVSPRAAASERIRTSGRGATWLACALFVLSGACGLAYEVVWSKYLGLFLGNTVLVHSAVLGGFMGGLAAGSLLIGKRAEESPAPLKVYGWLEAAVAVYAFCFPSLAGLAQQGVGSAASVLAPGSAGLLAVKLGIAAALLLPPTLMMGATFPYLTAHLERVTGRGEAGANWLYFANCAGAVLGTLLTGFSLIPGQGLGATVFGVAIFNMLIAIVAIMGGIAASSERPRSAAAVEAVRPDGRVLLAIALSGATAFTYELVWTRLFAVSLGSSTYSFTLMLAAFITGLAVGSIAANVIPAVRRSPLLTLVLAEAAIGVAVAVFLPLYPRLPYWFWKAKWLLRPAPESVGLYHLFQYALTFVIMAVPTLLFGLTFPTAIRAAGGEKDRHVAAHAAAVYGWNTVGTLVGVTLAGALLIPLLGLKGTLQVAALANFGIALLLISRLGPGRMKVGVLGAAAIGALLVLVTPRWPAVVFNSFRSFVAPPASWSEYERAAGARKLLFYREDQGTTVAVQEMPDTAHGTVEKALIIDGKTDATSFGDLPTQTLLAQVPLLLKPQAKEVFIIGLGSGVTAGSVLTHPVERVDCVEISPAVAAASRHFAEVNHSPESDPRFHLTLDDGKTFLASTPRRYDVIISEPTNPWISGVGNLFSEEAFRASARALKPGGVCAQWFHTYALDDGLVATIVRTFRSVYPHVVIFQGTAGDYLMLGALEPLRPDSKALERALRRPAVAADLKRIGITGPAGFLARQTHTPEAVERLAEGGGVNTDDLPLLEYRAPHCMFTGVTAERIKQLDCRFRSGTGLWIEAYLQGRPAARSDLDSILDTLADPRSGNEVLRMRVLRQYLTMWPHSPAHLLEAAQVTATAGDTEEALALAQRAAALGEDRGAELVRRIRAAQVEAQTAFQAAPAPRPDLKSGF